jgi:hypothetical protein
MLFRFSTRGTRSHQRLGLVLGLLLVCVFGAASPSRAGAAAADDELVEIATETYFYAFPMVIMDVTREIGTNCELPIPERLCAPVNQFSHARAFPDASFTDVVRANADTLYSALWFDLGQEPLVFQVPDSQGRYYLLPFLDMWTDVFAVPGSRTSGTQAQLFAMVGPGWNGELPEGMESIRAPTNQGWLVGRIQTDGKKDYASVHQFQAGLTAVPLSAWGKDYAPPRGKVDKTISSQAPVEQMHAMGAAAFFTRFADLLKRNPPHPNDYSMLLRMRRLGIEPGRSFDWAAASPEAQAALEQGLAEGLAKISGGLAAAGTAVGNWRMMMPPIGTYGADYFRRALIAYGGLGANVIEDAIYPTTYVDADGKPYDSSAKYTIHFAPDQVPPVRAFWSLTMYNDQQFLTDNPIDRYAIGDRDPLTFASDGSLTLYIQRESPGKDNQSNWLPAPKSGGFSMNLRLYWPRPQALDGRWTPPPVTRVR